MFSLIHFEGNKASQNVRYNASRVLHNTSSHVPAKAIAGFVLPGLEDRRMSDDMFSWAGRTLQNPRSSKREKSIAGFALQWRNAEKKKTTEKTPTASESQTSLPDHTSDTAKVTAPKSKAGSAHDLTAPAPAPKPPVPYTPPQVTLASTLKGLQHAKTREEAVERLGYLANDDLKRAYDEAMKYPESRAKAVGFLGFIEKEEDFKAAYKEAMKYPELRDHAADFLGFFDKEADFKAAFAEALKHPESRGQAGRCIGYFANKENFKAAFLEAIKHAESRFYASYGIGYLPQSDWKVVFEAAMKNPDSRHGLKEILENEPTLKAFVAYAKEQVQYEAPLPRLKRYQRSK